MNYTNLRNKKNKQEGIEVAIIGVACRVSGAANKEAYWEALKKNTDSTEEIKAQRWGNLSWYHPDPQHEGTSYSRTAGFISDQDKFDPLFFSLSPKEAELMDPQQRIFLEESWKCLEDAGYIPSKLTDSKVGVFVGAGVGDYLQLLQKNGMGAEGLAFTGSSNAVLASRIAYFLNFKGPTLTIDTACSSSLVAIDRAVKSIQLEESEMAIAGGVYLNTTPTDQIWSSRIRIHSNEGKCRAFDNEADGTILGEAVGVLLLKPLHKAVADDDRIYGVIKGSGVNNNGNNGTSKGITAPSEKAQSELEQGVYKKFQINPERISYVEAHGTGTKKGDPVEVNALINAFKQFTKKTNFCALGSVKPNIGHTAMAAGVCGVIKVLLMLQHKQLVPLVHFNKLNEKINLGDSPFYINRDLKDWESQDNQSRLAAVSSFGFSGTNAHLVLEEYIKEPKRFQSNDPAVILLSARNMDRLKEQASNLSTYLTTHTLIDLYDVAFTLQVGREPMEERLAFIVTSIEDLKKELVDYQNGKIGGLLFGNIKKDKDGFFLGGNAGESYITTAIKDKEIRSLAQLWVKGISIDWTLLYKKNNRPNKISLSTYPFARDRYWIPESAELALSTSKGKLHPLLHLNNSNLREQRFTSEYNGQELFLEDHKVQSEKILPGVAYLEMAREAGSISLEQPITQLKDITWLSPIKVNGVPKQIQISLFEEAGAIGYEIYSQAIGEGEGEIIHGRGELNTAQLVPPINQNITNIKNRLVNVKSRLECYNLLKKLGLTYGASFQGIEILYYSKEESLSKISLPEEEGFVLQPGILDSALQTSMGLSFGEGPLALSLPFSVKEVNIYGDVLETSWCYARKSEHNKTSNRVNSYDIDLLSDQGEVLLRFTNFATLPLNGLPKKYKKTNQSIEKISSQYFKQIWQGLTLHDQEPSNQQSGLTLIIGQSTPFSNQLKSTLESLGNQVILSERLDSFSTEIKSIYLFQGLHQFGQQKETWEQIKEQELAVFISIKTLLSNRPKQLNLIALTYKTQAVLPTDNVEVSGAGIIGLVGSLAKEEPNWNIQIVDVATQDKNTIINLLKTPFSKKGEIQALRAGIIYQSLLIPMELPYSPPGTSRFKESGVYVILGGAGGIGKVTTEYLIKNYNAQVYWLGRRKQDEAITAAIKLLSSYGLAPIYISCDATDNLSLQAAYNQIKVNEKTVHGLFHSAIVLQDMSLKNMVELDFKKAFDPKSVASYNLLETFKKENLDFVCFYSSVQSHFNFPGQSNYSAGCTYIDSYARNVEQELNFPSYTMNWGYWGEIGIVASPAYSKSLEKQGIASISSGEGMKALEVLLSGKERQLSFLKLSNNQNALDLPALDLSKSIIHQKAVSYLGKADIIMPTLVMNNQQTVLFEDICFKGLLQILLAIGIEKYQGEELGSLRKRLNILNKYDRLFQELIRALIATEYLYLEKKKFVIPKRIKDALNTFDLTKALDSYELNYPDYHAHSRLINICLNFFESILKGTVKATDIIFPQGSLELVSGIYKGNQQADYFNEILCKLVVKSVENCFTHIPKGEKITILEVGAGTGGTSELLFRALKDYKDQIRYIYTDISKSFLFYAEEQFKDLMPDLETQLFNIEISPEAQGLVSGSCDMVIGANVVHATKDIAYTLSNIKSVLKKDGLLLLNEIAQTEIFTSLIFGLLDGWWLYEDKELRLDGNPGLSEKSWRSVLEQTGYPNSSFFPEQKSLAQQIILTKSDGVILTNNSKNKYQQEVINAVNTAPKITQLKFKPDSLAIILTDVAAKTIKLPADEFDTEEQFSDFGFDSILGNQLINNINERLNINLKPTDIFNYPNIRLLTEYINENFSDFNTQLELENIIEPPKNLTSQKTESKLFQESKRSWLKRQSLTSLLVPKIEQKETNDIAVIGMSGQYGSAKDLDAFWNTLVTGQSLIKEVPSDRWDVTQHYDSDKEAVDKTYSKWGSFLEGIDEFDPTFFKISGREAENMDPQQRLFLQHCWKALEDAGISPKQLNGVKCSVYVGAAQGDYIQSSNPKDAAEFWGNNSSILAARISYFLNLKGPAIAIDTACSSSLMALEMACKSLQQRDTNIAISGGVFINVTPKFYKLASKAGMLSEDGRCYTFDHRANGFVPGEGVGVLVLKRLEDAEAAGDPIYGVIKGIASNQDGRTNGITAPSVISQEQLENEVFDKFHIDPASISYVEAHGTGTSLGDPIEFEALTKAFRKKTDKNQYCGLGSVKTNIGHTAMAAGVAGVQKVLLSMKHKMLPPSLNFEKANPLLDVVNSPFYISTTLKKWETEGNQIRRAAVSSFGFSGTNVHLVLEEYRKKQRDCHSTAPAIILLSAKNKLGLKELAISLNTYLTVNEGVNLFNVAYTLQTGRDQMEERLAFVVDDVSELSSRLSDYQEGKTENLFIGNVRKDKIDLKLNEEVGEVFINNAIENKEEKNLAQLWVSGVAIDWNLLYNKSNHPNKISLPSYPFARERYWIPNSETTSLQLYTTEWKEETSTNKNHEKYSNQLILLGGGSASLAEKLTEAIEQEVIAINEATEIAYFQKVLSIVQSRINSKELTYLTALYCNKDSVGYGFISGLLKTAQLERPQLRAKTIGVDSLSIKEINTLVELLPIEMADNSLEVRYKKGKREIKEIVRLEQEATEKIKLKEGGVYLISGGAGGLGELLANHFAKKQHTRLILTGRSKKPRLSSAELKRLHATYYSCDVTDKESVTTLISKIIQTEGKLNGIIHIAGVIKDSYLIHKTVEESTRVLLPKIQGAKYLDQATKHVDLDFTIYFSSIAGVLGNIGQADYASANAWLDHYAEYRNNLRKEGKRKGLTLSINWPLWEEGGMKIDTKSERILQEEWGMYALPTHQGLVAFDRLMSMGVSQGIVAYGTSMFHKLLTEQNAFLKEIETAKEFTGEKEVISFENLLLKVMEQVGNVFKIPDEQLQVDLDFADYGGDSILLRELVRKLNKAFSISLPASTLFEYRTIQTLTSYIIEKHSLKSKGKSTSINQNVHTLQNTEVKRRYPLSEGQKGLWLIQEADPDSTIYNVPVALVLEGSIDSDIIYEAAEKLMEIHPILRVVFGVEDKSGKLYQEIKTTEYGLRKEVKELKKGQQVGMFFKQQLQRPFDLSKEVLRLYICYDTNQEKTYILFVIHHIVFDGFSAIRLAFEFTELIKQLSSGVQVSLPIDHAYFDFINWEDTHIRSDQGAADLIYWDEKLKGNIEKLVLPYDSFSIETDYVKEKEGREMICLEGENLLALKGAAKDHKVNLSVFLLSVFKILLYRLSGASDIIVKLPIAGRPKEKHERSIGYYINMILFRTDFSDEQTFTNLVGTLQSGFISGINHSNYPYPKLLTELQLTKGKGEALFPVSFNYLNIFDGILTEKGENEITLLDDIYQGITDEYTMEIIDHRTELKIQIKYRTDLFYSSTIKRHLGYFQNILKEVIANPLIQISNIEILSEAEKLQLLFNFNNTQANFPSDKTIIDLFEEQVEKAPDNIAVVFEDRKLSYRELNEKANKIGHYLRDKYNIQPDDIVALQLERSEWMIIAILGVMKAGGAYLPIAPDLPKPRVVYMLEDSAARLLLTDKLTLEAAGFYKGLLSVEPVEEISHTSIFNPLTLAGSLNLSYIIYTSGSTGQPKGTLIVHQNVIRVVRNTNYIEIYQEDKLLQLSSYSFDGSIFDIFGALLNGAELMLISKAEFLDINKLAETIEAYRISVLFITTAMFNVIVDTNLECLASVRKILTGGEKVSVKHMERAFNYLGPGKLIHVYGPTESTVYSSYYPVDVLPVTLSTIPIGKPLSNTSLLILSQNSQLQPISVSGELCISGAGLAMGYLNNNTLTEEKFIPHPFIEEERLYKTGDLARWLPDGNIEFLGRIDHQLKIRGYRVEAGEIEQALLQHSDIQSCVVIGKELGGSKELIAYLVGKSVTVPDILTLRNFLGESLPDYMIPAYFVELETLPLISSGKVDRKALPEPDGLSIDSGIAYVAPRDKTEQALVDIWEELLKRENIGIHDNFFALGGQSLLAIQLVSTICKELGVKIGIKDLFANPSIAEFFTYLSTQDKNQFGSGIQTVPLPLGKQEWYLPSVQQIGFWVADQVNTEGRAAYIMISAFTISGDLNSELLQNSFRFLIERHDGLRCAFISVAGELRVHVHDADQLEFALEILDNKELNGDQDNPKKILNKLINQEISLDDAPLIRASLISLNEKQTCLIIRIHHIIGDGLSLEVLVKELFEVYDLFEKGVKPQMKPLDYQYHDYVAMQAKVLKAESAQRLKSYWLLQNQRAPFSIDLPYDETGISPDKMISGLESIRFDSNLSGALRKLGQDNKTTLFTTLLTGVNVLLHRYTGATDQTIGVPVSIREGAEYQNVIGLFLNTLPLRVKLDPQIAFTELMNTVKEVVTGGIAHQEYPFDLMLEDLGSPENSHQSQLFNVAVDMFKLNGSPLVLQTKGIKVQPLWLEPIKTKFDLTFYFFEENDEIGIYLDYNMGRFLPTTIKKMASRFKRLMENVVKTPNDSISSLKMEKPLTLPGIEPIQFTKNN
jgi:polyketide synthase PksM